MAIVVSELLNGLIDMTLLLSGELSESIIDVSPASMSFTITLVTTVLFVVSVRITFVFAGINDVVAGLMVMVSEPAPSLISVPVAKPSIEIIPPS